MLEQLSGGIHGNDHRNERGQFRTTVSDMVKKYVLPTIILAACALVAPQFATTASAQGLPTGPWIAPASAKAMKNAAPATPASVAAGKDLYTKNCVLCHGEKGDGQGLMGSSLDPKPANFADPKLMAMTTDGELFWKMTEGRGAMVPWKDKLSETERWQLVRYIRTFSKPTAKTAAKN